MRVVEVVLNVVQSEWAGCVESKVGLSTAREAILECAEYASKTMAKELDEYGACTVISAWKTNEISDDVRQEEEAPCEGK